MNYRFLSSNKKPTKRPVKLRLRPMKNSTLKRPRLSVKKPSPLKLNTKRRLSKLKFKRRLLNPTVTTRPDFKFFKLVNNTLTKLMKKP